jgi:hypothetical protein
MNHFGEGKLWMSFWLQYLPDEPFFLSESRSPSIRLRFPDCQYHNCLRSCPKIPCCLRLCESPLPFVASAANAPLFSCTFFYLDFIFEIQSALFVPGTPIVLKFI